MTLAIGNKQRGSVRSGFTLLEILLVIALIAVAVSVVILNFAAFSDRSENTSPEEVLTAAIRKARFIAAGNRITTTLRYDEESGTLQIEPLGEEFPINTDFGPGGRGKIRFFLIAPAVGLQPFSDPDEARLETDFVAFAPDRSASPFVAEIDLGQGSPNRLRFDPFSSVIRTGK
jgi:prepilin-type N-terminal cleavage/methylation domain-containing protein